MYSKFIVDSTQGHQKTFSGNKFYIPGWERASVQTNSGTIP